MSRQMPKSGTANSPTRGRITISKMKQGALEVLEGLRVQPTAKHGFGNLACQRGALQRAELVAEGFQICRLRQAQVLQGFGVSSNPTGLVAGPEQVFLRLLPVLSSGVVISQQARELVESIAKHLFDRISNTVVDGSPAFAQDAVIDCF